MLLLGYLLLTIVVLFALFSKGDVKVGLKVPFAEFSFEATDRKTARQIKKIEHGD